MKRYLPLLVLLLAICVLVPLKGIAKPADFEIAAVVNDEIITKHDLSNRIRIALNSTKLPDTAETRARLTPQLLQMLIDEALERQEAARLEISLSEAEMDRATGELEKQNNLKHGDLYSHIAKEGLDKDAVLAQVRTQLLWTKVIYKKVKPQISLSDQEVKEAMEKISTQAARGASEVNLAEIVLPVATPEEEQNVQKLATKLYEELQNGANFGSIAKEFSTSSTSNKNGAVGWLALEDLEPTLRQALDGLEKGSVSLPVRNNRGYMILKVLDKRAGAAGSEETPKATPDESRVRDVLTLRKMELEARRYLSTLRDKAYIEKRI